MTEQQRKAIEILNGLRSPMILSEERAISEDDEKELYEAVEIATKAEDPIGVDFSRILDKNAEERAQYSQLMMSLAALALAQIKMPPPEEKKSGLTARLEAMQKQAEELQRKRMEGDA
jgi:hypothetical protein